MTVLMNASAFNHIDVVKWLLEQYADVNGQVVLLKIVLAPL
jgi:hypothetical protein